MRVLVLDDDLFSASLTAAALQTEHEVCTAHTAAQALDQLESFAPHVVVCDLNLGPGPTGAEVLWRVYEVAPWIGRVVLTVHPTARLALPAGSTLPPDTGYVVKKAASAQLLLAAVRDCLGPAVPTAQAQVEVYVSPMQADTLRLMASGHSNAAIAQARGVSVRAVEASVRRLFEALRLSADPSRNPRVVAVNMWNSGQVGVRA